MDGKLYGVGVGPGDPELLTLKAVNTIAKCPVIAAPDTGGRDQLALQIAAAHLEGKEILLCDLPMTRDPQILADRREKAAGELCRRLGQGRDVAFLTLGDPSIYATYSYLHRLVARQGFQVEIIPGIPSFCAAAAALGEPLCENEQPLHILPGSCANLEEHLGAPGPKVLMKLGKRRGEALRLLERLGQLPRTALVERCTLPGERIDRHPGSDDEGDGYFSVLMVRQDGQW